MVAHLRNQSTSLIHIGQFRVRSGELIVSDPCYERGLEGCQGIIKVRNGWWSAAVSEERDGFISALHVWLNSEFNTDGREVKFIKGYSKIGKSSIPVPVDSGQAGFFCGSVYPHGDRGSYGDEKSFYGRCCSATLGVDYINQDEELLYRPRRVSAGLVPGGAVSSSGYGDGSYYSIYSVDENGLAIDASIIFLEDEDVDD